MRFDEKDIQRFVRQLFPSSPVDEMEAAGERVLARIRQQAPGLVEAFRFRPAGEGLKPFEELVLRTIGLLGEPDTLTIYYKMEELSSKRLNLGLLYVTLDRLEERGYITTRQAEPTADRGWRPKRCSKITEEGERALAEARATAEHVVDASEDFA